MANEQSVTAVECIIHEIHRPEDYPSWITRNGLAAFLHQHLKPYEDTLEDIRRGIADAFIERDGRTGFVLVSEKDHELTGALVMVRTGMRGYVPENLLLFVAVSSEARGLGVGTRLVSRALEMAHGEVKLHVEYDNPAKRLYERIGFTTKYAEMRYCQ